MKRSASAKEVGEQSPIFGIDSQEVEALRALEKIVWMYAQEDASFGDLISAANAVRIVRRGKRKN